MSCYADAPKRLVEKYGSDWEKPKRWAGHGGWESSTLDENVDKCEVKSCEAAIDVMKSYCKSVPGLIFGKAGDGCSR